eukprot:2752091-Alexandrium_andersonii.AAC.1
MQPRSQRWLYSRLRHAPAAAAGALGSTFTGRACLRHSCRCGQFGCWLRLREAVPPASAEGAEAECRGRPA